jgi:hypothetical protein
LWAQNGPRRIVSTASSITEPPFALRLWDQVVRVCDFLAAVRKLSKLATDLAPDAGERHFQMLEKAIRSSCKTPIVGWPQRYAGISIPKRHLGLQTAEELSNQDDVDLHIRTATDIAWHFVECAKSCKGKEAFAA